MGAIINGQEVHGAFINGVQVMDFDNNWQTIKTGILDFALMHDDPSKKSIEIVACGSLGFPDNDKQGTFYTFDSSKVLTSITQISGSDAFGVTGSIYQNSIVFSLSNNSIMYHVGTNSTNDSSYGYQRLGDDDKFMGHIHMTISYK